MKSTPEGLLRRLAGLLFLLERRHELCTKEEAKKQREACLVKKGVENQGEQEKEEEEQEGLRREER